MKSRRRLVAGTASLSSSSALTHQPVTGCSGSCGKNSPIFFGPNTSRLGASETTAATAACFGRNLSVIPDFSRADKVLAVDSDFLNASFSGLDQVRGFMARRRISEPGQAMNRLYVAETHYSSTGGLADHRLRIKPSETGAFLRALGKQVAALTGDGGLTSVVAAFPDSPLSADPKWIAECAKDLAASAGKSVIVVGDQQPAAVQALGLAINAALGAPGRTLRGLRTEAPAAATIGELAAAMQAGRVQNLFILGGNPVYNAPADLRFGDLLSGVPVSVRLGFYEDETSAACKWHVPQAHYLESWGDARSADGTICAVQPHDPPAVGRGGGSGNSESSGRQRTADRPSIGA